MTLRWVPGWNGLTEPEAVSYVAAVEAADGQELEFGVAKAINDFVLGCKNDGIWDAIKASCILAGARTLSGALVPLVGTAPTNFNFVEADYNRKNGLTAGSSKYINSQRANDADPQNNNHNSVYVVTIGGVGQSFLKSGTGTGSNEILRLAGTTFFHRNRNSTSLSAGPSSASQTGLWGTSRNSETTYISYCPFSGLITNSATSQSPDSNPILILPNSVGGQMSFYSIGESLALAALDTRVSNLITAIGAAIP